MEASTPPGQAVASRTRWWIHLVVIAGYLLMAVVLGVFRHPAHRPALSRTTLGLLVVCLGQLSMFALFLGIACQASRATADDLLLKWRGKVRPIWQGLLYSIALRLAILALVTFVVMYLMISQIMSPSAMKHFVEQNRPGVEVVVDTAAMKNNPVYFWLTITLVSFVVAGLREELWRTTFLAGLKHLWPAVFSSRLGEIGAVTIAAVLFGAAHISMGALAAVLAGFIGLGLGLVMVFHRSIWPAVIAHGFFDAASMAAIPYVTEHLKTIGH